MLVEVFNVGSEKLVRHQGRQEHMQIFELPHASFLVGREQLCNLLRESHEPIESFVRASVRAGKEVVETLPEALHVQLILHDVPALLPQVRNSFGPFGRLQAADVRSSRESLMLPRTSSALQLTVPPVCWAPLSNLTGIAKPLPSLVCLQTSTPYATRELTIRQSFLAPKTLFV